MNWHVDLPGLDQLGCRWLVRRAREEVGVEGFAWNPFETFRLRLKHDLYVQQFRDLLRDAQHVPVADPRLPEGTSDTGPFWPWSPTFRPLDETTARRVLQIAERELGITGTPLDPDAWAVLDLTGAAARSLYLRSADVEAPWREELARWLSVHLPLTVDLPDRP